MTQIDAVLIGRNEGDRLARALEALQGKVRRVVYVDSGSSDGSVARAEASGAEVVMLDPGLPFSAARARNAGFAALEAGGTVPFILFLDGDCALRPGFLVRAATHLEAHPDLGLVTGWRMERFPDATVYNRLCAWEWHRAAGPITSCGGDILVRAAAWRGVGGQKPSLIAGEDEEFCLRLAAAGWRMERLPIAMSCHDAAMTRFAQWWRRAERAGHAFAQVGTLFPDHWRAERRRVLLYAAALPLAALAALIFWPPGVAVPLLAYPASLLRTAQGLRRDGLSGRHLWGCAALLVLSKVPNLVGMLRFHARRARRAQMRLIEYK